MTKNTTEQKEVSEITFFAAEKLGVAIFHDKGGPFHQPAWFYTDDFTHKKFTLSSPDLFIKGLGVCPHIVNIHINQKFTGTNNWLAMSDDGIRSITAAFLEKDGVSEAFWTAWFRLEKGGA